MSSIVSPPGYLHVGIDDGGEGDGRLVGWSFTILDPAAAARLAVVHADLIKRLALDKFHGKEFRRIGKDRFSDFANAIAGVARSADIAQIIFVLMPRPALRTFTEFFQRVSVNAIKKLDPSLRGDLQDFIESQVPPLFWLAGVLHRDGTYREARISVDRDTAARPFQATEPGAILGLFQAASRWIPLVYNSYKEVQFPNAPRLPADGFSVVDSTDSALVQAADLVANFCVNHLRVQLGVDSKNAKAKSAILEGAFGPIAANIEELRETLQLTTQGMLSDRGTDRILTFRVFQR